MPAPATTTILRLFCKSFMSLFKCSVWSAGNISGRRSRCFVVRGFGSPLTRLLLAGRSSDIVESAWLQNSGAGEPMVEEAKEESGEDSVEERLEEQA
jgi:hypothetical protein